MADIVWEQFPSKVSMPHGREFDKARVVATPQKVYVFAVVASKIQMVFSSNYTEMVRPTYQDRRTSFVVEDGEVYAAKGAGCACGHMLKKKGGHELLGAMV